MVDEKSTLKFSNFFGTKNAMIEPTCQLLNKRNEAGRLIKFIQLDNAGENLKLKGKTESKD